MRSCRKKSGRLPWYKPNNHTGGCASSTRRQPKTNMSDYQLIPFGDLQQMATVVAKAGCFGFKTMEQAAALMLVAQADGLHPAKAATHYHIINGKPSLTADAMLARFQTAGGRVNWDAYSDDSVTGTFSHPQGGSVAITWTIARAKKAGVGNLDKFPAAMLRARCISEGVRTVYPGVIVGMYTPEEVSTFEQPIRTFEQPIRTLEIETVQETAPDSITLAPTMESLVLAFQDAVQGHPPTSAFYQLCKTAATNRKATL